MCKLHNASHVMRDTHTNGRGDSAALYTPGPWTICDKHDETVLGADGVGVAATLGGMTRWSHERQANARLIAAAPDLLNQLEFFAVLLEAKSNCTDFAVDRSEVAEWARWAREAVTAATQKNL